MTAEEIEDMKRELILLRMHKKRLESDLEKLQSMISTLLANDLSEGESHEHGEGNTGNRS